MAARETLDALDHGVLRFLTAGSVDDGKSTLIGRLLYDTKSILADQLVAIERTSQRRGQALDLSLLTDGLTAEREQGITIDVAYRFFATARRAFVVADTPGHQQYTRNMATGASNAELAILLVDARKGLEMFREVRVPLLGIVENMSYFVCTNCRHESDIFGHGGGEQMATDLGVPFVGRIPIYQPIREGSDAGIPLMISEPDSPAARAFMAAAERTAAQEQAQRLRGQLAEVEARLKELGELG